ncbi:hypothetical protein FNU79_14980 [Deinococcus detaillensis]|uniref:Caspase family protein n=1 Tax=Deinococcus detaillensis TaxID=2592048 RepID=A0A553UML7_9DEIO|nr:caspase family protein [Deinococcus detaillensis]TSA81433.1 hypothetical protein FNU79_14980 [Deinococcus detaillensis]
MPYSRFFPLWALWALLAGLALNQSSLAQSSPASPQLSVTDYTWSENGDSVELKLKIAGLSERAELRPYLRGGTASRAETKGTGVFPSAGPQQVILTLAVPPAQRWQPLSIGIGGFGNNQEADFNVSAPQGDLYVLAVGVKTFGGPDSSFPDLNYTVADAQALVKLLDGQHGRLYRKVNTFLLTEEKATRTNVLATMQSIVRQASANDTVIALFSSHGTEQGGQYYAMLYGGDARKFDTTAITGQELGAFYNQIKAKTLLLLDTCASGQAISGPGTARQPATQQLISTLESATKSASASKSKGGVNEYRSWITAAQANQESLEEPSLGHGLFTYAVLEALSGKFDSSAATEAGMDAQRQRDDIQATQLLTYVVERVRDLSSQYATTLPQRHVPYYTLIANSFPVVQLNVTVNVTINVTGNVLLPPTVNADPTPPAAPAVNGPAPDAAQGVFARAFGGKDNNSGAPDFPVKSLQKALDLQVGSRVTLSPGEYSLPKDGLTISRPLTITAQGGAVTLRCLPDSDGLIAKAENVKLEGLRFVGCALALAVRSGSTLIIGGEFRGNQQALLVSGGQASVQNTLFAENGANGSTTAAVRQSGRLSFEGGSFQNNDLGAIRADGDSLLKINNVNFVNNSRSVSDGGHIYLLGNAQLDLNQASFVGAQFSLVSLSKPKTAKLCNFSDQTPHKTYQVSGACS